MLVRVRGKVEAGVAYRSVRCAEFLLSADDGASALGSIECGFAFDYSLTVDGGATVGAHFAADAGDVVPVLVGHGV